MSMAREYGGDLLSWLQIGCTSNVTYVKRLDKALLVLSFCFFTLLPGFYIGQSFFALNPSQSYI